MHIYDIAVVGAGPAGIMAAICASSSGKKTVLIERNAFLGRKILLTGKGRCNITNSGPIDTFIEKFGKEGQFLRSAFSVFFNDELTDFFKSRGLPLKVERQGRVFPITDKAESVVEVLKCCIEKEKNLDVFYNKRIVDAIKKDDYFELKAAKKISIYAKKVIIATGGVSYRATGSTGDGFDIAKKLGHTIKPLTPALVPIRTKESWVKELEGLSLRNIRITFVYGKKKIISEIGELVFTYFGVSGPLVLDLSGRITELLKSNREISFFIDLKPGLKTEELQNKLLREFADNGKVQFKNIVKDLLPRKLIPVFVRLSGVDPEKTASQITKPERIKVTSLLKALPLTVTGSLDIEYAMVTAGGVSTKEINPRSMESRLISRLYFAGEIIEGSAPSGGYSLQQAFSTGFLAGKSSAGA
ncbi:MAG: NAD(P)/FAD-dependent oxidoreductase [Candidatus Omnitrophota bacterium]